MKQITTVLLTWNALHASLSNGKAVDLFRGIFHHFRLINISIFIECWNSENKQFKRKDCDNANFRESVSIENLIH